MSWLDKAYHTFLWFFGFKAGEHITDMLRRQKARMGIWWWVIVITTVVAGNSFIIWLILHILGLA